MRNLANAQHTLEHSLEENAFLELGLDIFDILLWARAVLSIVVATVVLVAMLLAMALSTSSACCISLLPPSPTATALNPTTPFDSAFHFSTTSFPSFIDTFASHPLANSAMEHTISANRGSANTCFRSSTSSSFLLLFLLKLLLPPLLAFANLARRCKHVEKLTELALFAPAKWVAAVMGGDDDVCSMKATRSSETLLHLVSWALNALAATKCMDVGCLLEEPLD
mmetsp:Transcript_28283/g.60280  ORF Transcript_28283/g.60280 Transcript_28283/m.60280 type:complete len:225 (+) Transcript_28283:2806-3480(+)